MGQLVYIKAKTGNEDDLNKKLKKAKIKNLLVTAKMNQDWLNNINSDPKSHQKHLKPKDRDLTMEELKSYFSFETKEGLMSFDVAFDRTSEAEAKKYAEFIEANKDLIEYVKGGDELINRYKLTPAQAKIVKKLEQQKKERELLPKEDRTNPELQGGLYLCKKTWNKEPFWLIFGNVEKPTFLKVKKYKNDLYNDIYRDKKGYAYMLIPLLPLNNNQIEFVQEVYEHACSLGLRENYNFIIPLVYGLDLINLNEVADNYKEAYTPEELQERFETTFSITSGTHPYNNYNGFIWKDDKKRFMPVGGEEDMQIRTRCSILTALAKAIGGKNSAMIVSELTGKRYLEFEFE